MPSRGGNRGDTVVFRGVVNPYRMSEADAVPSHSHTISNETVPYHGDPTGVPLPVYDEMRRMVSGYQRVVDERTVERASAWVQEALREDDDNDEERVWPVVETPSWGNPYREPRRVRRVEPRVLTNIFYGLGDSPSDSVHSKGVSDIAILFSKEKQICQGL